MPPRFLAPYFFPFSAFHAGLGRKNRNRNTRHSLCLHHAAPWFREVRVGAKEEGGGHFHIHLTECCVSLFCTVAF